MWYYYGAKLKLVDKYPKPAYKTLIEPFAGSAQYSLKYWDNDVILVDKYNVVARLWKWLQLCSEKDILSLPVVGIDQTVDDFTWDCDEAKWLVGFNLVMGSPVPRRNPTKWTTTERPHRQFAKLKLIADSLYKIRHWVIINGDYQCVNNIKATWFIDPPYMVGGGIYRHAHIDYVGLADWTNSRMGEIIVCGNADDTWLDFKPLATLSGVSRVTKEAIVHRVSD